MPMCHSHLAEPFLIHRRVSHPAKRVMIWQRLHQFCISLLLDVANTESHSRKDWFNGRCIILLGVDTHGVYINPSLPDFEWKEQNLRMKISCVKVVAESRAIMKHIVSHSQTTNSKILDDSRSKYFICNEAQVALWFEPCRVPSLLKQSNSPSYM